jgi:DNA-binding NarL/FixJ family response regulator
MTAKFHKAKPVDRITVVILEDNSTLVIGMRAELDKPDIFVAAVSSEVDQFLEDISSLRPAVAIVDLRIWKDFNAGFEAIRAAKGLSPETRYIVYTAYDEMEKFHTGINLGIRAFVSKNIRDKPLDEVVRIVFNDGTYYGDLLPRYLEIVSKGPRPVEFDVDDRDEEAGGSELSPREFDVISLLDAGSTTAEIAGKLCVTENTVKAHTKHIRAKYGVKTTAEAVRAYRLRKSA